MAAGGRRMLAAATAVAVLAGACGHSKNNAVSRTRPASEATPATSPTSAASPSAALDPGAAPTITTTSTTTAPPVAADPASLGRRLGASEEAVRRTDLPATERDQHGEILALGYRQLGNHPSWMAAAVAAAPADMRAAVDRNGRAAVELRALTRPKEAVPPWRIVPPRDGASLLASYHEAETKTGVPWAVLAAVHFTETNFGRIRGDSTSGARGPMQFLPATWSAYGQGDIEDDRDAILAAARYLKANGAPQDLRAALYHYNHSVHYVNAVLLFAEEMNADASAYFSYYFRPVVYSLVTGDVVLRETG